MKKGIVFLSGSFFVLTVLNWTVFFETSRAQIAGQVWIVLTSVTVWKCWLRKDNTEGKPSLMYGLVTSAIAIITCSVAAYYLYNTLPTPASPEINNLTFYADGKLNDFEYVCEFLIRNDGDKPCELENVEFALGDAKFEDKKSGRIVTGSAPGGSGGLMGGGGGVTRREITTTHLPQKLPPMNIPICIVGKATSKTLEDKDIINEDRTISITFVYGNGKKPSEPNIPIVYRNIDSIK